MVEYLNNQSGGCTETTPVPQLRESCQRKKHDTADYLGDSDELDEFAVHSSDGNLTNKEEDMYLNEMAPDREPVHIVEDYFQTQEAGMYFDFEKQDGDHN